MTTKKIEQIGQKLDALEAILAKCEAKVAGGASVSGSTTSSGASGAAAEAWDRVCDEFLTPFMTSSADIGDDVAKMAKFVEKAFKAVGTIVDAASKQKKPKDIAEFLAPIFSHIKDAKAYSKKKFRTKTPLHLRSMEEALGTLAWTSISPAPVPFLKDSIPSVQFHTNKILREFRGKDDRHVEWAKQLLALLNGMHAYVKDCHMTGLTFKLR